VNFALTPRSATTGGGVLSILGVALAGLLLLTTPFTGCTEIGVLDDANTGDEFVGIESGTVVDSSDGVKSVSHRWRWC
jgi:hypothetical protein